MLSALAGIIPAACYKSESMMCLHVGRCTKEAWACISGKFTGALMVNVKDSEIVAEVWYKHKLHQVFLNPTMMQSAVAAREFSSRSPGSHGWFRTSNGDQASWHCCPETIFCSFCIDPQILSSAIIECALQTFAEPFETFNVFFKKVLYCFWSGSDDPQYPQMTYSMN